MYICQEEGHPYRTVQVKELSCTGKNLFFSEKFEKTLDKASLLCYNIKAD